jgi:hypothetical protein
MSGAVLSIDDIIADCLRLRRAATVNSKVYLTTQEKMFQGCWEALNLWILFRMKRRQVSLH